MNLLEAIQQCGDNWFRETDMKGSAEAFSFNKIGMLVLHRPSVDGFEALDYSLALRAELNGQWEIVTPEQVMEERK